MCSVQDNGKGGGRDEGSALLELTNPFREMEQSEQRILIQDRGWSQVQLEIIPGADFMLQILYFSRQS